MKKHKLNRVWSIWLDVAKDIARRDFEAFFLHCLLKQHTLATSYNLCESCLQNTNEKSNNNRDFSNPMNGKKTWASQPWKRKRFLLISPSWKRLKFVQGWRYSIPSFRTRESTRFCTIWDVTKRVDALSFSFNPQNVVHKTLAHTTKVWGS